MTDRIEKIGHSLIQHGALSERIYLMKLDPADAASIVPHLEKLAKQEGYSKVFAKIPSGCWEAFLGAGYQREALIPKYFGAGNDCIFAAKYLTEKRSQDLKREEATRILSIAHKKKATETSEDGPSEVRIEKAGPGDAEALSCLYEFVFPTYPFPITDPKYLIQTMKTHIDYYFIAENAKMVAAVSSEKDLESRSVEFTDFATLPECRGRGLALELLKEMEKAMRAEGFLTGYTICRALSAGMNIVFAKAGYVYAGTLVNNTNISGSIESMNVWYKYLDTASL